MTHWYMSVPMNDKYFKFVRHPHVCAKVLSYIILCGNTHYNNRLTSQVPRQLVRSAFLCWAYMYFELSSVCSGLWDVGNYPTLVNLAYYCGSCLHLSLVCNFHVHTSELSFLGTEPEHTMCFCLQALNPWPWTDWPSNSLLQISIFM